MLYAYHIIFRSRAVFVASILAILISVPAYSNETLQVSQETVSSEDKQIALNDEFSTWSYFRSYMPVKRDYGIEIGGMWEKNNLYWVGANAGFHIGRCIFSLSQTCQQYVDIIGGVGGRDGLTMGLAAGSMRWQFVSYPNKYSTFARVFVGVMNIRDESRDENHITGGLGYGFAASVHRRVDLKWEMRVGASYLPFAMVFFSINLKVDKLVGFFADKIKTLGRGTIKATGSVLRSTISAPVHIIDWVKEGVDSSKKKEENAAPNKNRPER